MSNTRIYIDECLKHRECDSSNTMGESEQLVCKVGEAIAPFCRPTRADIGTYQ
jgi:hypothetical protein